MNLRLGYLENGLAAIDFDQLDSKVNVLSTLVWTEFGEKLEEVANREGVRGLMIRSAKPGIFIAGADLKEFRGASPENLGPTRTFVELGHRVLNRLETLPFPTAGLIDGACLGGGLEVALACDFRLCGTHPKVRVGFPEVTLGLIPGWGGTQRTSRLVGPVSTLTHVCAARNLGGERAVRQGIADEVVPSEKLSARAAALLANASRDDGRPDRRAIKNAPVEERWTWSYRPDFGEEFPGSMRQYLERREGPPRAASLEALEAISRGIGLPLQAGLRVEQEAFLRLVASEEAQRTIEAFFARKK